MAQSPSSSGLPLSASKSINLLREFSIPLIAGVIGALFWANLHIIFLLELFWQNIFLVEG